MIFRLLIFIALSAAACAPLTLLSSDGGESITAGTDGGHLAEHTRIAFSSLPVASSRAADEIVGVSGEPGELYAMSKDADVFRSAGNSFAKWLWLNKTGMARDVLKVGSVTAFLFDDEIMTCGTPCTTTLSEFPIVARGIALCGRSSEAIYAVGRDAAGTVGSLYRYNGTRWSLLSDGLSAAFGCAVAPDGVLYIASSGGVMRYSNALTFEEVAASTQFSSIVAADDGTIFAGGASATIARRVNGSWAVLTNGGATTISGIIAYAADDVVFVDDADSPAWARWNGVSISQLGAATPDLGGIRGAARVAADEHYAFGASAEHKPIIYRVERLPSL